MQASHDLCVRISYHRSLIVYLPASESFYHFDSSHGRNEHAAALTAGKFWQVLGKKGQFRRDLRCIVSPNGRTIHSDIPPMVVHPILTFYETHKTGAPVVDVYVACPQQENGYDCGMFVAGIAKHLTHTHVTRSAEAAAKVQQRLDTSGLRARVTQDYIDELRRRLRKRVKELAAELGSSSVASSSSSFSG